MLLPVLVLFAAPLWGQISGTLLSEPGDEPVADAERSIETRIDGVRYIALSYADASGRFKFEGLPPAPHRLYIRASGHAALQPEFVNLKSGASRNNLVYRLARSSFLSGRVTSVRTRALSQSVGSASAAHLSPRQAVLASCQQYCV